MKPLAYAMRPTHYDEIVGQDHLVGKNGVLRKMIESNHLFSFILYGEPGCGKTTIAEATRKMVNIPSHHFNASTDNKDILKQIVNDARFNKDTIIVVDEIHRMKKDIQDFLLPYVEDGTLIMIGLTTVNPYHSVNPAIRSRCHIFKLNELNSDDMHTILRRAYVNMKLTNKIDEEVYDYLVGISGYEIRSLINNFEMVVSIYPNEDITLDKATSALIKPNVSIDANQDSYYDTLSGLQKSIRGSDVDAALHYLAKLIIADDLQSLSRRLLAIAYEDIGLANPTIGPRVKAAVDAARELGNPEARLPLSVIVIEMALSPKSNSAYLAIAKAMEDIENGKSGTLPLHLKNTYSFNPKQESYKYPHDYPNAWVNQQYLPDTLKDSKYYTPKDSSKLESSLKERYLQIERWKKQAK
ncbi:MAG: replication-associated recombination protein A [Bacilli bacterium]|nr:replication-associated recombination protein A [Bacilli bacterium]